MSIPDLSDKKSYFFQFFYTYSDHVLVLLNYTLLDSSNNSLPPQLFCLHVGGNILTIHDLSRKRLHLTFATKVHTARTQLTKTIWTDINIIYHHHRMKFRQGLQSQLLLVQTQHFDVANIFCRIFCLDALGFCSSCCWRHPGTGTQFSKARFRRGDSASERIWIWERLVYSLWWKTIFNIQLWWSLIECVCVWLHGCQDASIVVKRSSHALTHSLICTPTLDCHYRSLCCTIWGWCNCAGIIAGIIIMVVYLSTEPSDRGRA